MLSNSSTPGTFTWEDSLANQNVDATTADGDPVGSIIYFTIIKGVRMQEKLRAAWLSCIAFVAMQALLIPPAQIDAGSPETVCPPPQACHPTPVPTASLSTQFATLLHKYRSGPMAGFIVSGPWVVIVYNSVNNDYNANGGVLLAQESGSAWNMVTYGAGSFSIGDLTSLGVDSTDAQNIISEESQI